MPYLTPMDLDLPYTIQPIAELPGHDDRAWHVAWNPTRPLLASCSADKTVRMYAYTSPAPSTTSPPTLPPAPKFTHVSTIPTGHTKAVRSLAWSPSGQTLATASFDSNIGIWEQEADEDDDGDDIDERGGKGAGKGQWECASQLEGHETECKSVAYSSTGTLLASCSRDKTVWIWEVHPDSDFECMGVLMEHSQDVKCVAWHPTEEILASASYDDTIKLYIDDPSDDWFCFTTLTGHTSTVWSVAWSPNGEYLASASDDRTVRIWKHVQESQWECVLVLAGHERSVYSVTWGIGKGKGKEEGGLGWVASTGGDGTIRVWELSEPPTTNGTPTANITPPNHKLIAFLRSAHGVFDINTVTWCPRPGLEDLLATAGDDGAARFSPLPTDPASLLFLIDLEMAIHGLPPTLQPVHPAHFDIEKAIRPNILALHPYRCARDDYQSGILLDANENALGHSILRPPNDADSASDLDATLDLDLHRYPDPSHASIKQRLASLRGLPGPENVFLGVGSDEVIDLLMRVCVTPGAGGEKIMITPPTYGMYSVCAQVNDVGVVRCPLELSGAQGEGGEHGRFSLRVDEMKKAIDADPSIKIIFLCSPGNPTGTLISLASIRALLDYPNYKGVVVVDEAYIDFAGTEHSAVSLIKDYANIVVMQTLSKGFGLAAIRLGIALAQPPLIQVLANTKAPYNISTPTAHLALSALSPSSLTSMRTKVSTLISSRASLLSALSSLAPLGVGKSIGGNDANFVLVPILTKDGRGEADNVRAQAVYRTLAEENGVVVRFRGGEMGCTGCLRITVGSEKENRVLVEKLGKVLEVL
ncbi:putative cytosolic iron-sulfur protein assembly protein 1 [Hypsizygus marmoreus]|uniref:Probable cytosolic iron-sulfur protein assembly protein 1 n=1 Tax=Hypsizygus marmoreus TaxID=39966 RepID=A0A369JIH4_HYPMA|nr:putative cytosolic iron-sulfur protein assembly protein 1 [Hypsizygus marmoreus]